MRAWHWSAPSGRAAARCPAPRRGRGGVSTGSVRRWLGQRDEFRVARHLAHFLIAPCVFGALDLLTRTRDEIPFDKAFAFEFRAAEQHRRRALFARERDCRARR